MPIDLGDKIPDVDMLTVAETPIKPSDYAGRKWVLYFYPKDDTSGCTKQAQGFSDMKAQFDALGVDILGVSKDPPKKHIKFMDKYDLKITLASDPEDGLANAMGVWVEKQMYGKKYMGMERSTFLIDADGIVQKVWRKVKVKDHVEAVYDAAKAL